MLPKRDPENISFYSVGLLVIAIGAGIVGLGIAQWFLNYFKEFSFFAPSIKAIGGLVVISLGYIQIEVELLRKRKQ